MARVMRLVDDDKLGILTLVRLRVPMLIIGLVLGLALSFVTSEFEEVLRQNVEAVFFLPFIVYMADAMGTQTQTIYIRNLTKGKAGFFTYLVKETVLGILVGLLFGLLAAAAALLWFKSTALALTVGMAMGAAVGTAPIIALIVTEVLELEHQDPAVGAGPIATVIQDVVSITLFGLVASSILL